MKLANYLLLSLLSIAILSACKKDDPTPPDTNDEDVIEDTSSSRAYFPTHLGSYWVYDNGDTAKISDDYVETYHYDVYSASWWAAPSPVPDSQQVWSPYYSNPGFMSGIFRNYTFYPDTYHDLPYKIYSDQNDNWTSKQVPNVDDMHLVVVRDSVMTFLGESMEVTIVRTAEESDLMIEEYTGNPEFWGTYRYFAKNVGLIKTVYKTYPDSTEQSIELVEYFINE